MEQKTILPKSKDEKTMLDFSSDRLRPSVVTFFFSDVSEADHLAVPIPSAGGCVYINQALMATEMNHDELGDERCVIVIACQIMSTWYHM